MKLNKIYQKWKASKLHHLSLKRLLQKAPSPEKSLEERVIWLQNLIKWIQKPGFATDENVTVSSKIQRHRLNSFIHQLKKDQALNNRFGETIASILLQTESISLLSTIGLVEQDSIYLDLSNQICKLILPQAPDYHDLAFIINNSFTCKSDYVWLSEIDTKLANTIFQSMSKYSDKLSLYFKKQAIESIYLLCSQASGLALHNELRNRMRPHQLSENPFFQMETLSRQLLVSQNEQEFISLIKKLELTCSAARDFLRDVPIYLKVYGVNTNIVFKIEKLEGQFDRILLILSLLGKENITPNFFFNFLEHLIEESVRRRSIFAFASDRLSLLSRRITERNAETGEHYIARNAQDFFYLFKKAIGGGIITAFTVIIKFISTNLPINGLAYGFASSLNYSISFLTIHFLGYTLATKQPSMTASALAEKIHYRDEKGPLAPVCNEIIHLVRSQMIAVVGNIFSVVIVATMLCFLLQFYFNASFVSTEKAMKTISDLSIFGMTSIYAIFTGFLLFSSSLIAGWLDNWFVYHQLEDALMANRRVQFILGKNGAIKFSNFWKQNFAGITSNILLGFMLGLTPVLGAFLSLPLDVRHVTLSSGALAVSVFQIGLDVCQLSSFWFAILGLISIAILNLSVSFVLTLVLAIRAKKVTMPKRKEIFFEILARLKENPFLLFIPPKS